MKRLFFTLILFICPLFLWAQNSLPYRYTYLWDVTYSMHGGHLSQDPSSTHEIKIGGKTQKIIKYNAKYDIYDAVLAQLVNDLGRITPDAEGEIVVIPFADTIVNVWRAPSTPNGIKELIQKIKNNDFIQQTNTNLSMPLEYVLSSIITKDKFDVVKLLTDGKDNMGKDNMGKEKFKAVLSSWCDRTEGKNVYGFYYMLTDNAIDSEINNILNSQCRMKPIPLYDRIVFAQVSFRDVHIKLDEAIDKPINVSVSVRVNETIPQNMKVKMSADNEYFTLDTEVAIDGKETVQIQPIFKMDKNELHSKIPVLESGVKIPVYVSKVDEDMTAQLVDEDFDIILTNSAVKKLNIYVQ